jgi:cyclopropane fatty-acyl-phospholipid synthase-like methyltransferase
MLISGVGWNKMIGRLVKDKRVLICGVVEDPPDYQKSMLRRIRESGAGEITGIDIQACTYPGIQAKRGDVQNDELGGPYDVIVATKIFNHLSDPKRFIERSSRALAPNGMLIIKTPNSRSPQLLFIKMFGRMAPDYINKAHVCWYDLRSIKVLVKQGGMVISKSFYMQSSVTWKQKLFRVLCLICPAFAEDILAVCIKQK